MTQQIDRPTFKIHPSVVLQLGADLVTDRIQALLELVKNAYDADSPGANVTINTQAPPNPNDTFFPNATGSILIDDLGFGMDWDTIKRGWLTVSNSPKREMKAKGEVTPGKHRTPLGDKGVGRLGTQALGRNLEIWTCADGAETGHHVGLSWTDFGTASDLDQVSIRVEQVPKRKGTRLLISNIHEPDYWLREKVALQRELSQVFFPFGQERPFIVRVFVDGEPLDLTEIITRIRDTAPFRYKFEFDGERLQISGRYRLNYVQGDTNKAKADYTRYIEVDQGAGLMAWLQKSKKFSGVVEYVSRDPGWLLSARLETSLQAVSDVRPTGYQPWNPGPFSGELDYFDLSADNVKDIFNAKSAYREFVKDHSGIRVYRDGFAVRPYGFPDGDGHDWLGLGKAATSAHGTYFMKAQNALGFVSISAVDNKQLTETTSREGFQDTHCWRNFRRLMVQVIDYINQTNTTLRKGANEFLDARKKTEDNQEPTEQMRKVAEAAKPMEQSVVALRANVEAVLSRTRSQVQESSANSVPAAASNEQTKALAETLSTLSLASNLLSDVERYLSQTRTLAEKADRVEREIQILQDQVADFTELAGLGLAAEAFTHELDNIADGLKERTLLLQQHIREVGIRDPVILAYMGAVREVIQAMRKQLSHLSPSLRYVREERDDIDILVFFEGHIRFFKNRLTRHGITYDIRSGDSTFIVRMNRGKLTQVMDNLVLNSKYWLKEAMRVECPDASIHVAILPPYVQIWDTGLGVDPNYEDTLFEPFVTAKPRGKGRGLGLYIVRQLLDSDGCRVGLLPDRNGHGRRYKFQLDLSGAHKNG